MKKFEVRVVDNQVIIYIVEAASKQGAQECIEGLTNDEAQETYPHIIDRAEWYVDEVNRSWQNPRPSSLILGKRVSPPRRILSG